MNRRHLLWISAAIAVVSIASPSFAQEDSTNPRHAEVRLLARSYGDSVVLRYGVTKPGAWAIANRYGYKVERVAINAKGEFDRKAFRALTPTALKPLALEEWKTRYSTATDSNRAYPAIEAQMLYGKSSVPKVETGKDVTRIGRAGQELEDRFGFALFAADIDSRTAEAAGLRYADHDVHPGDRYLYRAFVAGKDPTYPIDTAYLIVDVAAPDAVPAPTGLVADTGDGKLRLHWYHPTTGGYTAYLVYRSEDGGGTYKRMTATPLIAMRTPKMKGPPQPTFEDTTVVNYKKYRYAVYGITPFAELSEAALVDAMSMDLSAPPAPIPDDPKQVGNRAIHLAWQERNPPPDLAGFLIARSGNSLTGFQFLQKDPLPKNTREFTDNNAVEGEPYYQIAAIDTAGNIARSIVVASELIDTVPPTPPTGLVGSMDTNGIVSLHWHIGPERNLIGYRVLWANDPKHEFTQRTGEVWSDTSFTDTVTMNTLTEYVYYRVAAVNIRKNHSEMSAMLAVRRPDRIPPESSVFKDVIATDSSAELHWAHSRSEDVLRQVLYRRSITADYHPAEDWKELAKLSATTEFYSDTHVKQRQMYQYQIIVEDSSGNRSKPSFPVQARPYDPGTRPGVRNFTATYDERSKNVHLSWAYSPRSEDYWFTIYRAVDDRSSTEGNPNIAQYRSIEKSKTSFDDPAPGKGTYVYAVRMVAKSGAQSPLSDNVTVTIR